MTDTTTSTRNESFSQPLTAEEQVSTLVYETVADITDTSPLEMTPLGAVIDTKALDGLVAASVLTVDVTFDYEGHKIHLTDDELVISPQSDNL